MSERTFRFILGASLLLFLYLDSTLLVEAYIALLIFEGLTNLRVPILVSRIRYGKEVVDAEASSTGGFEAERALRLVVASMLILSYVLTHPPFAYIQIEFIWFFPWFIGFMMFMAGVTNLCPMVMFFRWIGLR